MAFLRSKGEHNADYALLDIFKYYKTQEANNVDYKTFASVIKEYNSRIMDAIIYEKLEFKMSYNLGYLRIQRRKKTAYLKDDKLKKYHLGIDWKKTKDFWLKEYAGKTWDEIKDIKGKKKFTFHNDHTNGWSCRFFWDKTLSNVKNQSCYVYKATRTTKEELARFIKKTGVIEYYE